MTMFILVVDWNDGTVTATIHENPGKAREDVHHFAEGAAASARLITIHNCRADVEEIDVPPPQI